MKVLVLEGEPGVSCGAALRLAEAGHTVARCHARDEAAFPCRGLSQGDCPLDAGDVDVALVVRGDPIDVSGDDAPDRTAGEDGARCALRRHLPLVVAGDASRSPLLSFAAAVSSDPVDVARIVEAAASAPMRRHADVARATFAGVLEAHGLDPLLADARVTRRGGQLHVELNASGRVPAPVLEMASVRVAGALRALDPSSRSIDVVPTSA